MYCYGLIINAVYNANWNYSESIDIRGASENPSNVDSFCEFLQSSIGKFLLLAKVFHAYRRKKEGKNHYFILGWE